MTQSEIIIPIIEVLLQAGADPDIQDEVLLLLLVSTLFNLFLMIQNLNTALHFANKSVQLATMLLNAGANPSISNKVIKY